MSIEIKGVSKSFDGKRVLDNLNMTLEDNSTTCIMGESGCGKTTLINLIMGLIKPDEGEITGVPEKISVVFQEDRLCERFTAFENVKIVTGNTVPDEVIIRHLKEVGIYEPGKKVCDFSGGMKRRAAIVRAVLYGGDLFIMDEALKGLDDDTRLLVADYIKRNTKGKQLIFITHDTRECELMGARVITLKGEL